jgi:hypothetical protein
MTFTRSLVPRRIRLDVLPGHVQFYVFDKPESVNQKIVQEFCNTPIQRIFTTRGIPGIDENLAKHLRDKYNIKNPLDFVKMLRFNTREYRRLPVHFCASIVANFLDDVWFHGSSTTRIITASICVALSENRLRNVTLHYF